MNKALATGLILCSTMLYAQEATEESKPEEPKAPTIKYVYMIFCENQPDKVILLDNTGKWIPDVKSVSISLEIGKPAKCIATIWKGFYKPSNPETKVWELKQAKSVDSDTFQQYIDKLQSNPTLN